MKLQEKTNNRIKTAIIIMSVGVVVNLGLFFVKLFIGLSSNSIGILTDSVNNLGDTFVCIIAIASFAMTRMRSDKLSFGSGRMEYVADFLMAIILCVVGGGFMYTALERMVMATPLRFTWNYFIIIGVTVIVKVGLGVFYVFGNKKINSDVLKASAFDSFTDAGITAMTMIGYLLNKYVSLRIDAIFGIAISGIILANGIKLLISSVKTLLGEKISDEEREKITAICMKSESVEKVVGMNLHKYGAEYMQIVIDLVFTKEINYDKINKTVADISDEIKTEYGYFPKICIARIYEEGKEETQ